MVEYSVTLPYHYDGVSEYACEHALTEPRTCGKRVGRFCRKQLDAKEYEPPFCKGAAHPTHL